MSILDLQSRVQSLAAADRELFGRLFSVSVSEGGLRAPESMRGWLEDRFGSAKAVERQTVVRVTNRWTLEEAVFNPLRAHRLKALATVPPPPGEDPLSRLLELTPEDTFGRIEGEHCLTAANVAKAEAWHGLIVLREPNPLAFTRESVRDCRAAAEEYRARHGADYFRDLVRAHAALGLAVIYEGAAVLASLTPAKEREIMIIAPSIEEGMAEALYAASAIPS